MQQIPDRRKYMNELIKKESMKLGVELSDRQAEQFALYYEMLIKKNEQVNLTAIIEKEDVAVKHFTDSLGVVLLKDNPAVKRIISGEGIKIIDIGTGAGFPGVPLKILFPQIRLTLLDSLGKRISFLQGVVDQCGLTDTECLHARAEEYSRRPEYREKYDLCVSRAVTRMASLTELCLPYVKVGGRFIPYKAGECDEEINEAREAIAVMGGKLLTSERFLVPESDLSRTLVVVKKERPTDKKYPRGGGKPMKNPIVSRET